MKSLDRMPTARTPETPHDTRLPRIMGFCLPHCRTGSAASIWIDFGARYPFTCVPAHDLPVYASQCPLPDPTQNSVHGCWLGFAAAAISGDWISCACKAQPAQIHASGTTARGSSLGFWRRSGGLVEDVGSELAERNDRRAWCTFPSSRMPFDCAASAYAANVGVPG